MAHSLSTGESLSLSEEYDVRRMRFFPYEEIAEADVADVQALLDELKFAHAPITGRRTACALVGEYYAYTGHTLEQADGTVHDAVTMAAQKIRPEDSTITKVFVTGADIKKHKHIMPTRDAYDLLSPFLSSDAPIVMVGPNELDMVKVIPAAHHHQAYEAPNKGHVFSGISAQAITIEALQHTLLNRRECVFLATLRLSGLREGIQYYLTGSSSGLGGPSYAVQPDVYEDLDLIAISEKPRDEVEDSFQYLMHEYYGDSLKLPHPVKQLSTGEIVQGSQFLSNNHASVDLFDGKTIAQALFRTDIFERELLHKLS